MTGPGSYNSHLNHFLKKMPSAVFGTSKRITTKEGVAGAPGPMTYNR